MSYTHWWDSPPWGTSTPHNKHAQMCYSINRNTLPILPLMPIRRATRGDIDCWQAQLPAEEELRASAMSHAAHVLTAKGHRDAILAVILYSFCTEGYQIKLQLLKEVAAPASRHSATYSAYKPPRDRDACRACCLSCELSTNERSQKSRMPGR